MSNVLFNVPATLGDYEGQLTIIWEWDKKNIVKYIVCPIIPCDCYTQNWFALDLTAVYTIVHHFSSTWTRKVKSTLGWGCWISVLFTYKGFSSPYAECYLHLFTKCCLGIHSLWQFSYAACLCKLIWSRCGGLKT